MYTPRAARLRATALSLALVLAASMPLAGQKYLRRANKLFDLRDYAAAIDGFERALRKRPDGAQERARLAYSLRMTGDLDAAADHYALLVAAEGDNPDYAYQQSLTLAELGRYRDAVEALSLAAQLGHPDVAALGKRISYAQQHTEEAGTWRVTNEFVNTAGDEYGARPFGEFVVYASDRDGEGQRLWLSPRDGNGFLRLPRPLHKVLTAQTGDGPVAYSPSGELVAYTRNNFATGERFLPDAGWELSLVIATANAEGDFRDPKPFAHNGPGFSTGFPSFSPSGDKLYFASDRPGGRGGFDLYVSERTGDGWGEPRNLGSEINTPGNEITPFAAAAGLYFASDYLPGYGGMDIFRADMRGGRVTAVSNLGLGVNSPLDDAGFALANEGRFAYFTSNRPGGKGGLDLYRGVREGKSLTVAIVDAQTGAPVPMAALDFSDCGQGNFLTGVDGEYTFRVVPSMNCEPTVRKAGYGTQSFAVDAAAPAEGDRVVVRIAPRTQAVNLSGTVVHAQTGEPLEGVRVLARPIDGGAADVTETLTDGDGGYALQLERGRRYGVAYQADGLADIDREVTVGDVPDPEVLGSFALFPQLDAPDEASDPVAGDDGPLAGETPSGGDDRLESISEATTSGVDALATSVGSVREGYAVQVAALAADIDDISEYAAKLREVGRVYGKREGSVLRVRLGPFDTKEAAAPALSRAKALGFGDAFIARESGGDAIGAGEARGADRGDTAGSPTPADATPGGPNTLIPAGTFLVRLATYADFKNFDAERVATLGTLTTRKRDGMVVVLLQGFTSPSEAQAKVEAARAAGYTDAHVVVELRNGELRRLP